MVLITLPGSVKALKGDKGKPLAIKISLEHLESIHYRLMHDVGAPEFKIIKVGD